MSKLTVVFGTGSAARQWVSSSSSNVSFFVDNDSTKWGTKFFGLDVLDPSILDGKQSIYDVIIASSYVHVISHQLKQYGFVDESIATVPYNAFLISHGVSAKELFICLNEFNIRYVVMRNFATLPDAVPGDIDILIHDADIPRLADCPLIPISAYHKLENSLPSEDLPVKIDIYAACGTSGFRYQNLPIFSPPLALEILSSRVFDSRGFYIPSPSNYAWSYLYYICYFKSINSGLPLHAVESPESFRSSYLASSGWLALDTNVSWNRHDFVSISRELLPSPYDEIISLCSIHEYLTAIGMSPSFSTLRRLLGSSEQATSSLEVILITPIFYHVFNRFPMCLMAFISILFVLDVRSFRL